MKIETNTDILRIISTNLYSLSFLDDYDFDYIGEIDKGVMDITEEIISEALNSVIPCTVKAVKVFHPKQYNYYGDDVELDITISDRDFERLKNAVLNDPNFKEYLKRYSSHSGFISYMADNLIDFESESTEYQFAQAVSFYITDSAKEEYQEQFIYDLWDYCSENFNEIDENDDYYYESFSRKVKPMVKKIKNEVYRIGSYGYTDTWNIIDGLKKYCKSSYNLDKVEEALYKVEVYAESNADFDELYKFLIDASGVYSFDD